MKKLTAGILTVLLGIVSANSADAAVASKGYVDDQRDAAISAASSALGVAKTELQDAIDAKVAQSDYDAKVAALEAADKTFATTESMTEELAKKQNKLTVTGGVLKWDAETSTLDLTGIATSDGLEALQNTVNTLDGDESTAGSVKKQIADAIASEVLRSDAAYATAAQGVLADSAVQFDDVATTDKAGVVQLASEYTDTDTTKAVTGAIVAKAISDSASDLSSLINDVSDTASDADALSKQNKATLDALDNTYATDAQVATAKSEAIEAAAADATSKADAAEAAAKANTTTQISNLNLNDLSRVPADCSEVGKYCVLTSDGTNYLWEVIERGTDEAQPAGTAIPSVTTGA